MKTWLPLTAPLPTQASQILDYMRARPNQTMTLRDIANGTTIGISSIRFYLPDMCKRGIVKRVEIGVYCWAPVTD